MTGMAWEKDKGEMLVRVLIIEDDAQLNASLKRSLVKEGYAVDVTFDGQEGLAFAEQDCYDVIVLDLLLPKLDGIDVCRAVRSKRIRTPILLLTARDSVEDRVRGLDTGADDYLIKPFVLQELLARIRALLRRDASWKSGVLTAGDLCADPATRRVERAGRPLELTAREFALLDYFLRHPNQVLTREMIEAHIWNYDFISESNVVDAAIRRLRRKIDDPFETKLLETIRGVGYRLRGQNQS
jgi:two-component system, OmpR family, copper resistance phosphate regulon response regulator CusR